MLYTQQEPKNKKAKRALLVREPKLVENEKRALFIHGHSNSNNGKLFLDEMTALKQPNAVKLSKKNNKILPFEDEGPLEFLGHKNDASLFMLGTSNKKRPDNIVMGRLFDFHVLDMVEFGVTNLRPASSFKAAAPGLGMRPCFVFCGDEFEQNPVMKRLANLFLDFFGGRTSNMVNLRGLENVIVLTAVAGVVHFRHYSVALQKSGERVPRVELEEVGPAFEVRVGRSKLAQEEQWRQSTVSDGRVKDVSKPRKNVVVDTLGSTLGTVHVGKQDLTGLVLKKSKALRPSNKQLREEAEDAEQRDPAEGDDAGGEKKTKKKKARVAPEATDI